MVSASRSGSARAAAATVSKRRSSREASDRAADHLRQFWVKYSLKIALAALLTILVPTLLHMQAMYMCPVMVVMLMGAFHSDTIGSALNTLCCVPIALAGGLLITAVFGAAPPIYFVLMLAWFFAFTLLLDRYTLGTLFGSIGIAIMLLTAIFESRATLWDFSVHYYALLLIALTIGVAVDHLLWPPHRRTVFLDVLAAIYESLGTGFSRLRENRVDDEEAELRALLRLHELSHVIQSYHGSGLERSHPPVQLLMHSGALLLHLDFQRREFQRMPLPDEDRALAERLFGGIAAHCYGIGQAALAGVPAAPVDPWLTQYAADVIDEEPQPRPAPDLERRGWVRRWRTQPTLPMLARTIIRLGEATDAYNRALARRGNRGFTTRAPRVPLTIDTRVLKRSAKTALIFVLLLIGQGWLDLPGGTMAAFFAVLFGTLPNLGQVFLKAAVGLSGLLIGLSYALVCIAIVAALPSFALFLGLVFLGIFCTAYFALQPLPWAFGAMHAGLVIPYATLVYDGPDWTLVEAETRAFGLLTAGCVALLVHRFVWPALPLRDLRRSIGASLTDIGSKLGNLLQHAGPADPTEAPRHLLPLSAVVPKVLSLSNDARYLFSVIDEDSRHFHNVIQGLMSLDVHLSLVSGVIGRLEPAVLEQFRVAVAPTVARLAEGCRSAGAMFEPAPAPPTPAGRGAGAAMEALKPLDAKLRARGPAGEEQRHYVWLLGRSLDHLAAGLDEIVAEADAINRTRPGAGERS